MMCVCGVEYVCDRERGDVLERDGVGDLRGEVDTPPGHRWTMQGSRAGQAVRSVIPHSQSSVPHPLSDLDAAQAVRFMIPRRAVCRTRVPGCLQHTHTPTPIFSPAWFKCLPVFHSVKAREDYGWGTRSWCVRASSHSRHTHVHFGSGRGRVTRTLFTRGK